METKSILIIENAVYVPYERVGECQQCGACCKQAANLVMTLDDDPEEDAKEREGWSVIEGIRCRFDLVEEYPEPMCQMYIDGRCISDDERGKRACRIWPVHPDNLALVGCPGFTFRRVENGGGAPKNGRVDIEAMLADCDEDEAIALVADGQLTCRAAEALLRAVGQRRALAAEIERLGVVLKHWMSLAEERYSIASSLQNRVAELKQENKELKKEIKEWEDIDIWQTL